MIKIVAKPYSTTQYHPCLQQHKEKKQKKSLACKIIEYMNSWLWKVEKLGKANDCQLMFASSK